MTELIEVLSKLRSFGWSLRPDECWLEDGYVFYREGDECDPYGYIVQVDPDTGMYRTKGNGSGCFWTDWTKN